MELVGASADSRQAAGQGTLLPSSERRQVWRASPSLASPTIQMHTYRPSLDHNGRGGFKQGLPIHSKAQCLPGPSYISVEPAESGDMIGVHTPYGTIILPTLISLERYEWLYAAHSRLAQSEAFSQDLLKLLARYHPWAKSLNPQGRKLKLANHWATPPLL